MTPASLPTAHQTLDVDTPVGVGRWLIFGDPGAVTLLGLAPGHSGHTDAPDLVALANRANAEVSVAIWTPPFVLAGRGNGSPPAVLDQAWLAAAPALRASHSQHLRWIQGGHSAGARMACRTATATGAHGVLACSFPLHPPGRPASSRSAELLLAGVPVFVVQGSTDTFGTAAEVTAAVADADGRPEIVVYEVTGAGHTLVPTVRADPTRQVLGTAIDRAWEWVRGEVAY